MDFGRLYGDERRIGEPYRRRIGEPYGARRRRQSHGHGRVLPDLLTAAADQPLIGGDQRHVGIDEHPAVFGRHLRVEMQVVGRPALALEVVTDLADHLALAHQAAADQAVGVELPGQHVQVAEADALVRRIGHEVERLLAGRRSTAPSRTATTSCW